MTIDDQRVEDLAKELAVSHGSKIAVINLEGTCTNAYLELTDERRWRWPRGLHTADLLVTYMEYHWRDFLTAARAKLIGFDNPSSSL